MLFCLHLSKYHSVNVSASCMCTVGSLSQAARNVDIVVLAGSIIGGSLAVFLLLGTAVTVVCTITYRLLVKQKGYNLSTDVEHRHSTEESNIVTTINTAYKSVKYVATIELEGMYVDTSSPGAGTTLKLQSPLTENWDSKLNMEENVAYGSKAASDSLNVTYDYVSIKSSSR